MRDKSLGASDLGGKLGYGWARMMRTNLVARRANMAADPVAEVATGLIPEDVEAFVMEHAGHAFDHEDPSAFADFWSAFVDGTRLYLAEQTEYGMGDN